MVPALQAVLDESAEDDLKAHGQAEGGRHRARQHAGLAQHVRGEDQEHAVTILAHI
jgi:hypothetical protein